MLDERTKRVLFAVIQCSINSPGPVGSRVVTKRYSFDLSPATIRNIMSDLEDLGFLRQPHTSAGRVPTEAGYRFYVDALQTEMKEVSSDLLMQLSGKLEALKRDVYSFLDEASKMLSTMSHYIGIAMSPSNSSARLSKIELIKYRGNQLAVILFTDEGIVRNKLITVDPSVQERNLQRIADCINSEFRGWTIEEIRQTIAQELTREKVLCDTLITEAMKICRDAFSSAAEDIFISGIAEMLALPDFCDIDRIKGLLKTIEDKHTIIRLLDGISASEGTQVFIGSENPLDELKQFSLVASTYRDRGRPLGAIGIIGPTRMNYVQAISVVETTAHYITAMLSR
jgi:heat-inducible transcriptional repressor